MKRPRKGAATPAKSTCVRAPKPITPAPHYPKVATARAPIRSSMDEAVSHPPEIPYDPPRKNGRFLKGKSGNKRGRTKGSKNKKTVIIEMMESKLGRKIPDPRKLTRYEGMMFKAIQKALGGDIRSMGFVLSEYRKAIESSGSSSATATIEEDQQAYDVLCAKIRREIEDEIRSKILSEVKK